MTSVLSFFVFSKKEIQKTENEIRLPFYRFSFYVQTNTKTKKQKSASLLSFFLLSTNKHIIRKNGNRLPFYRFLVFERTDTKNGKRRADFHFNFFRFMKDQTPKTVK